MKIYKDDTSDVARFKFPLATPLADVFWPVHELIPDDLPDDTTIRKIHMKGFIGPDGYVFWNVVGAEVVNILASKRTQAATAAAEGESDLEELGTSDSEVEVVYTDVDEEEDALDQDEEEDDEAHTTEHIHPEFPPVLEVPLERAARGSHIQHRNNFFM